MIRTRRSAVIHRHGGGLGGGLLCAVIETADVPTRRLLNRSSQLTFAGYPWTVKSSTTPDRTGSQRLRRGRAVRRFIGGSPSADREDSSGMGIFGGGPQSDPWLRHLPLDREMDPRRPSTPTWCFRLFTYDNFEHFTIEPGAGLRGLPLRRRRGRDECAVRGAALQHLGQPPTDYPSENSNVTTVTMTWLPGSVTFSRIRCHRGRIAPPLCRRARPSRCT